MEIFKDIKEIDDSKLHPKYKLLRDNTMLLFERNLLESWTHGMKDKDHKMVREFQESFHPCLWEFYLYNFFTEYGFVIDQNHQMPDFIITSPYRLYVEAVVSNIREGGKSEEKRTIEDQYDLLLPPYLYKDFYKDLDEAITRHANSLQQKLKKYNDVYRKREWVDANCPYVIALSSYDQINYGREYIYSMMALLYGAYYNAQEDNYSRRDYIIKPGTESSEISLGLFVNENKKYEYSDISAVIFSCTITLGKLTSILASKGVSITNKVFNIRRYNDDGDIHGKYLMQIVSPESPEELADGVFVFHNPNARVKFPEDAFANIPVTQFFFDNGGISIQGNETPLIARHNTSYLLAEISSSHVKECVRLYNRLSVEDFYVEKGDDMLKVEKEFSIKQLIEDEDFAIVLDTNILLNIYRYSPDFSAFALECLGAVKDKIILPSIVRMEYGKRCRSDYSKMSNRVSNAKTNIQKQIDASTKTVLNSLNDLKRFKYPDVEVLREELKNKMEELKTLKENFFDDRSVIDYVAQSWNSDLLMELVEHIENRGNILPELTAQEVYDWDEEGERRYKKNIPPGYMDAKEKKGVRQYSDFFIWKEVLRYAKKQNKDVIFVTDDTKEDWWLSTKSQMVFRPELLLEFEKTGSRILPLTSDIFYKEVSDSYNINRADTVEIALNMTDSEYGSMVAEKVFDNICDELYCNATDYIDEETAHIGTEGIDEFEIVNYEFVTAERLTRVDSAFKYIFEYSIVLEGTSYDYWGRDDDTKEIIKSLGRDHVFKGRVFVQVEREADIFIDIEDSDFETAKIVCGEIVEASYIDRDDGYDEEYQQSGELGSCPDCGIPLNIENNGGNGFCINCAPNH